MNSAELLVQKLRHYPFWSQLLITLGSLVVLISIWTACGPSTQHTPEPPSFPPLKAATSLSTTDRQFPQQEKRVDAVAFDLSGRWMATAGNYHWQGNYNWQVLKWDFQTGMLVRQLALQRGPITSVAFSRDGRILATASKNSEVALWDATTGEYIRSLLGHKDAVRTVVFSPDGLVLASASADRSVKLWDVEAGLELRTLQGHTSAVNAVAFSPDGLVLATASSDKTVRLWDAQTGELIRALAGHNAPVVALGFRPDGKVLASGSGAGYKLWDVGTGGEILAPSSRVAVTAVAFRPDGQILAIAYAGSETAWNVDFLNLAEGRIVKSFAAHWICISAIAWVPDGSWLVSVGPDGGIRCWR